MIYKIAKIRDYLPPSVMRVVYLALMQSVIQYEMIGWGAASPTIISPLLRTQRILLRVMLRRDPRHPSYPLFREMAVLPIKRLYIK